MEAKGHSRDRNPDRRERNSSRGERSGRKSRCSSSPRTRRRKNSRQSQALISNFPFNVGWLELRDLFNKEVGGVTYVEVIFDRNNHCTGKAIIDFTTKELRDRALKRMKHFSIGGRKLSIKGLKSDSRDRDMRESPQRVQSPRRKRSTSRRTSSHSRRESPSPEKVKRKRSESPQKSDKKSMKEEEMDYDETYGLARPFLRKLGVRPPTVLNRVYVSNLPQNLEHETIRETFKIAGDIRWLSLLRDHHGKSKGRCVVEYIHPVYAVQAMSMLNGQIYHGNKLCVEMDHDMHLTPVLPKGLKAVRSGLGPGGAPLGDIADNYKVINETKKKAKLASLTMTVPASLPMGVSGGPRVQPALPVFPGFSSNVPFFGGGYGMPWPGSGPLPFPGFAHPSAMAPMGPGPYGMPNVMGTVQNLNNSFGGVGSV